MAFATTMISRKAAGAVSSGKTARYNCYYLAETVKSEQEKKCEGCCYAKTQPCVSACCYKELDRWLKASREMRREKDGAQNEQK